LLARPSCRITKEYVMPSHIIKTLVPPRPAAPRAAEWIATAVARLLTSAMHAPRREQDLLALAGEVEREQPGLACELRGIAMHVAAASAPRRT
jgi:hypothetical protein